VLLLLLLIEADMAREANTALLHAASPHEMNLQTTPLGDAIGARSGGRRHLGPCRRWFGKPGSKGGGGSRAGGRNERIRPRSWSARAVTREDCSGSAASGASSAAPSSSAAAAERGPGGAGCRPSRGREKLPPGEAAALPSGEGLEGPLSSG
jgi:hypothetical protein